MDCTTELQVRAMYRTLLRWRRHFRFAFEPCDKELIEAEAAMFRFHRRLLLLTLDDIDAQDELTAEQDAITAMDDGEFEQAMRDSIEDAGGDNA